MTFMPSLPFARFPPSVLIKAHVEWLTASINFLGGERFLALTPPFLKRQRVWDRNVGRVISFEIRDYIDWFTSTQIFYQHDYDLSRLARAPDVTAVYDGILRAGHTPLILDCGGNVGLAARYFATTWPQAKVLSIEPDPGNAKLAIRNTLGTGVQVLNCAVGSSDGRCAVIDPGSGHHNAYRVVASDSGDIEVVSLPTLLDRPDLRRCQPFIVKIDIEGFEADLFAGNTGWIDHIPILIIELHDWMLPGTANSRTFLAAIAGKDRDFLYRGENVISIANTASSYAAATAPEPQLSPELHQ
jgi:FkbM family methyltransferase